MVALKLCCRGDLGFVVTGSERQWTDGSGSGLGLAVLLRFDILLPLSRSGILVFVLFLGMVVVVAGRKMIVFVKRLRV